MKKLTPMQQKFADSYIETGNATQSAISAGYSEKTARFIGAENLTKPNVKKYIDEQMDLLHKATIASADDVLQYLTSVMNGNEQEEVLIGKGMGEQSITTIDVSAKDRIKAAELIGKRHSLFTDKHELSGGLAIPQIIDDVPKKDDSNG